MDALYSKLYDKYTKLKAKKSSEIELLNFEQEEKFKAYLTVTEELIAHLQSEKNMLHAQVNELRQEVASIRSAKDEEQEKYESMLMEENQKNKELLEEIERLNRRELRSSSPYSSAKTNSTKRKRNKKVTHENEVEEVSVDVVGQHESENTSDKEKNSPPAIYNTHLAKCCRRRPGDSVNASDASICMFQELVECLFDLKFSVATQSDDMLLTALHESSGYSFNLRWVKTAIGEEWMYRVSSLGTYERLAPEWMRDAMIFSKSMCRVFFDRLSTVVKNLR